MGLSESSLSTILRPCDHCKIAAKCPCCEIVVDTHDYETESASPSLSATHQRSNLSLQ